MELEINFKNPKTPKQTLRKPKVISFCTCESESSSVIWTTEEIIFLCSPYTML